MSFISDSVHFSVFWGMLADVIGRKETMLLTAFCMALSTIMFGLSTNYDVAITARFLQGSSYGT